MIQIQLVIGHYLEICNLSLSAKEYFLFNVESCFLPFGQLEVCVNSLDVLTQTKTSREDSNAVTDDWASLA